MINTEDCQTAARSEESVGFELPDGTIVLLPKATSEAKAKQRVKDLEQAEFIRALGERYSVIQTGGS